MSDLTPIYMWAGGKSKLIKEYSPIWPDADAYDFYVEPFFGGGAVYCWLNNEFGNRRSIVGDVNAELMQLLSDLRKDPTAFIAEAEALAKAYVRIPVGEARKVWYYKLREKYWASPSSAKLYILMRTGFNGIWQTCKASSGNFGTPAGLLNHVRVEQVLNVGLLHRWAEALSRTTIHSGGYDTISIPTNGRALIYLDPPYRDSFTTYGTGFGDADQKKLVTWSKAQVALGHTVVLANRCVENDGFFEELLPDGVFHYFDVTYTAGRRKQTEDGFEAKKAREFVAILGGIERIDEEVAEITRELERELVLV